MIKLIKFIAILLGKTLLVLITIPSFIVVLIFMVLLEASDCPSPTDVFEWYLEIVMSVIKWFKDLWRNT